MTRSHHSPDRPWVFRTYSGHSSARASNELYRTNLAKGQTGLSVAFDLPTQTGFDSDHPLARGEVGKVGVPICHLDDMLELFAGLPLDRMNTSMTINATAAWLLALYVAAAERTGVDPRALQGTTQNDIIKEYLSRGTYVFPPEPSMRLTSDVVAYSVDAIPKWNPINVCSYHLQEAGATPVQEIAFALATAIGVLDAVRARSDVPAQAIPRVVGRISFFLNSGIRFVEEVCKTRAMAELWDEITRERYGVADEELRRFRYGVQVNSLGLTESQPENNAIRIALEALGVTLSKRARCRALQLPAWNEALGLPRPWDQQWSLRIQQILAYETDLLVYEVLFDGSKVVESHTRALRLEARAELDRVLAMGGCVAAVENAWMKQQLVESQTRRARDRARGPRGGGREPLHRGGALAAPGGGPGDPARRRAGGARAGGEARRLPRAARRQGRGGGAPEPARGGLGRRERDAALDPRGARRRHDGRVGRGAARALRRVPRPDRGGGARRRPARRADRRGARARARPRLAPRAPAQGAGREARPRRPQQRGRADRGARARRRHGGRLRGDPPDARADRALGSRRGRAPDRALDPLRLPRRPRARGARPAAQGGARGAPDRGRRDHPGCGRGGAPARGSPARVHAEGLRSDPHHGGDRRRRRGVRACRLTPRRSRGASWPASARRSPRR